MQLKRVWQANCQPDGDFLMVGFEELATGHDNTALVLAIFQVNAGAGSRSFECLAKGTRF